MAPINQSAPTKIVGKEMRSYSVEASYPGFEPAFVGVKVLHMIDLGDLPNTRCQINRAVGGAHSPSCRTQRRCLHIACQDWLEHLRMPSVPTTA